MVIVGSWGCMFYWCMFYVWENDVTKDEALKMALEALEFSQKMSRHYEFREYHHEIAPRALYALRQALEQPSNSVSDREEQEFLLRNYVVCDRCNQVINKEFERLQREQFFYKQVPNVLPASNKGESHE